MASIPTFPAPASDLVETLRANKRLGAAVKAYRKVATATLADGSEVQMSMGAAMKMMRAIRSGMPAIPVAVSEEISGDTTTRNYVWTDEAREHAWLMKHDARYAAPYEAPERFAPDIETGTCDRCGKRRQGVMQYSPDASGYPTPVMFQCWECLHQRSEVAARRAIYRAAAAADIAFNEAVVIRNDADRGWEFYLRNGAGGNVLVGKGLFQDGADYAVIQVVHPEDGPA